MRKVYGSLSTGQHREGLGATKLYAKTLLACNLCFHVNVHDQHHTSQSVWKRREHCGNETRVTARPGVSSDGWLFYRKSSREELFYAAAIGVRRAPVTCVGRSCRPGGSRRSPARACAPSPRAAAPRDLRATRRLIGGAARSSAATVVSAQSWRHPRAPVPAPRRPGRRSEAAPCRLPVDEDTIKTG